MHRTGKGSKGRGKWSESLLELARKFQEAEKTAALGCWSAAEVALRMRGMFPKRASDKSRSWEAFVKEVLGKSRATVYSYLQAARYVDSRVGNWRGEMATLPPVWLVSKLAGLPECDEREALHSQVWAGDYENDQMILDEVENVRSQHATPPEPQAWRTGESHGVRPKGAARKKRTSVRPQVLPIQRATEYLSEAIGDQVRIIPGPPEWNDVEDLLEDLDEKITANLKHLRRSGAVIVIHPTE